MYRIEWKNSARRELRKLEKAVIVRVIEAVENLASNPHPGGSKKLQGSVRLYRVRVGDYRVVYSVEDDALIIEVIRVGHRKNIYRPNK